MLPYVPQRPPQLALHSRPPLAHTRGSGDAMLAEEADVDAASDDDALGEWREALAVNGKR